MSLVTPASRWRPIDGCILGLPQACLLGGMQVDTSGDIDATALDEFMATLMPLTTTLPPPARTPVALLERVGYWSGEVQRHARMPVSPAVHVRQLEANGQGASAAFEMAVPVISHQAGAAALQLVVKVCNRCLAAPPIQAATLEALRDAFAKVLAMLKSRAEPGFNHFPLLMAAHRMGLQVTRISGRNYRLGTGAKARLMNSTVTDHTPALGMALAQDKWLTSRMLASVGLPGTVNELAADAQSAVALAQRLGYPVVVKPADQEQGRGVAANLVHDDAVRHAYALAAGFSKRILVEKHVPGWGHRFTVHQGELIAVGQRIPGGVTGDGQSDITQLLALQLQRPEVRRSINQGRVTLDDEALALLADQGLTPQSAPAAGAFVLLRRRDNISAGGIVKHLDLASIHPDNMRLALRAARALYLDIAGVDILCPDVTRSWMEVGAAICEVNARPQFGPGGRGDNYDRVLRRMFGHGAQVPVQLYLCDDAQAADLPARLQSKRHSLGLQAVCCAQGLWLDGVRLSPAMKSSLAAARAALADRDVESLLMAFTPDDIVERGLPLRDIDAVHVAPHTGWPAEQRQRLAQALRWCACAPDTIHFEESAETHP